MKLTNEWVEANACTTMGADDDRVFVHSIGKSIVQVAYWSCDNIKVVTVEGPDSICEVANYGQVINEFGDSFEVAISVDGGTILAIDAYDDIVNDVEGYSVTDSNEYSGVELYDEFPELARALNILDM